MVEHQDRAGAVFHPPLLLAVAIAMGFVLGRFAPLRFLSGSVATVAGPVITATSFLLFFWAVTTLRRGGGSIPLNEPTHVIVVNGPYRFSRNPIYLSMVMLQVGIGAWSNSLWFMITAMVSAGFLAWGVIDREERYLERKFGDIYRNYRLKVRRWL